MNKIEYNRSLYHHGILGQKWGKKNGPPYPLGSGDHSVSEKKAGWRKSLDKDSDNKDSKKREHKGLTDKQKKILAIGIGTAAVATLAVAGGLYLKNHPEILKKTIHGSLPDDLINKTIKELQKPETISEAISKANPKYGQEGYTQNCTLCGIATYLRRKGLDVTAGKLNGGNLNGIVQKCFKGAKIIDGSAVKFGKSKKDAAEMLVKRFGENAEGLCGIEWKSGSSHAFNFVIKDGIVEFFDGQIGLNGASLDKYWNFINPNGSLQLARLDNAEPIMEEIMKLLEY